MRKTDLQTLSTRKLEAAHVLAENKMWANAYYLAGYSVELAFKACFAKTISADTIPDKQLINRVYTHNYTDLRGLAGLKTEFDNRSKTDNLFAANWAICSEWSPDSRYQDKTAAEAQYLLVAISDKKNGVLPWITTFW
jgi:HEPN domain-containing protein